MAIAIFRYPGFANRSNFDIPIIDTSKFGGYRLTTLRGSQGEQLGIHPGESVKACTRVFFMAATDTGADIVR